MEYPPWMAQVAPCPQLEGRGLQEPTALSWGVTAEPIPKTEQGKNWEIRDKSVF